MSKDFILRSFADIPKLVGKSNWVEWEMRVRVALGKAGLRAYLAEAIPTKDEEQLDQKVDLQLSNWILDATDFTILSAHYHLIDDTVPSLDPKSRLSYTVFSTLRSTYGTSNAQYAFSLARRFVENRCDDNTDINAWVNEVRAQYRELVTIKYNLEALCVNVLLQGLPDRFNAFVDNVWSSTNAPTIDNVSDAILRIDAGQHQRDDSVKQESALVSRRKSAPSTRGGRLRTLARKDRPSTDKPCHNCGSRYHWASECPEQEEQANVVAGLSTMDELSRSLDESNEGYEAAAF